MASFKTEPSNPGCGYYYCGNPDCQLYFQVSTPMENPPEPTEDTPNPVVLVYDEAATYDEYWAHTLTHPV